MKRNGLFLIIFTLSYIPLETRSSPRSSKRKRPFEDESEVMHKIRLEYESEHHQQYMADKTSHEKWHELAKNSETMYCQKYIDTLFSETARRIVKRARFIKIILRYNKIAAASVPLISLQCEILPAALGRKYINFIRSPRTDCLFLIRRFVPKSNEVIISEKICLNHKYKFWSICLSLPVDAKLAPDMKGRKRTARYVHDDPQKRKEYEINHQQDYKCNADSFATWPELKKTDSKQLCVALLNELLPKTPFSEIIVEHQFAELEYAYVENKDSVEVEVSVLKCQIPKKNQRCRFHFIKGPTSDCVYLIRQKSSNSINFQITKLICLVDGLTQYVELNETKRVLNSENGLELQKIKEESQGKDDTTLVFNEQEVKDSSIVNHTAHQFF